MSGSSGRKSVIVGVVFLSLAVGIIIFSYVSQRVARRAETSSVATSSGATAPSSAATAFTSDKPTTGAVTATSAGAPDHAAGGTAGATEQAGEKVDPRFDYGVLPSVKGDANPQVRSVAEALRDKNHPERLSPLIQPKPFDAKAYKADPSGYLKVVEPGRVFQTAQPGKDVPHIRALCPQMQEIKQGESVKLRVQAAPKYPVSFCSFDGGTFKETGLNSITVEANEVGVAEVTFVGAPGTINECNVLAGSPMASGQVKYMVNITRPEN